MLCLENTKSLGLVKQCRRLTCYNQNLNTTEEFFEQNQMQCHDRIVVVGNGFDIRAGLKSKFEDFIFFYESE